MTTPGKDVFVLLDLPYKIKDVLYGKGGDMHSGFSHEEFVEACKNCNHNWQITYNEHPWLRDEFKDYTMENFEFTYSLAHRPDSNKNKKEELLIYNYPNNREVQSTLLF